MEIQVDILNKQLIVQLTDTEFAGMSAFGTGALRDLQNYATNFFSNKLEEYKQVQRDVIIGQLRSADAEKMAEVISLLTPPPPPPPPPDVPPVVAPPVVESPIEEPPVEPAPILPVEEPAPPPVGDPVVEPMPGPAPEPLVNE